MGIEDRDYYRDWWRNKGVKRKSDARQSSDSEHEPSADSVFLFDELLHDIDEEAYFRRGSQRLVAIRRAHFVFQLLAFLFICLFVVFVFWLFRH